MWLRRVMVMAAAVMVASSACAGAPSEGPPDDGANASAVAAAVASSSSLATVEVFDASRTLTSSEANNAGNLQVMNFQQRRNAPSVAQGGLSIPGCGGTGVNAGGSRPGGSGFLGWSWTDGDCYLLLAAAQFTAIGMPDSACDMVLEMDAVQEAYEKKAKRERGRKAKPQFPNCTSSENRDLTSAAAELDRLVAFILAQPQTEKCGDKKCLTEEALRRAFEASQRK